jgi:hypothetical protein
MADTNRITHQYAIAERDRAQVEMAIAFGVEADALVTGTLDLYTPQLADHALVQAAQLPAVIRAMQRLIRAEIAVRETRRESVDRILEDVEANRGVYR